MAQPYALVVEDERTIATLLSRLVADCGVEVGVARNGGDALRDMMLRRPDVVLLDLIMPVMSGEEVLAEMQADPRFADIPVIIISTKEMESELPETGVAYLQKPFVPADVKALVRETLGLA